MARESKRQREWQKFTAHYESKPKKGEIEIGKAAVDRIVQKRTFEYFDRPQRGVRFHIFRNKGDEITGRLVSHAITNLRRNSSYALDIGGGEIVEVFANRTMHTQLSECFGRLIRIVYLGREQNNWGHAKKIYRVYQVDRKPDGEPPTTKQVKAKLKSRRKESGDGK
ncbi:hypothetical protein LCGC14_1655630 [marine sediment metagenome]|uniref:Uncharacterized protein n=1 Tax=marine sediment metagenome TaxID=412755 RepID=A0A0F9KVS0_9ZZZZ